MADALAEAILTGRLLPGDRLNESRLSREMKVSRAPVREALIQMAQQGLVMNHPRRGMFVVELTEEDIQKINSVRLILEAEALRLARVNAGAEGMQELVALVKGLEAAPKLTPEERAYRDFEFHRIIWRRSGNEFLERTLITLVAPVFAQGVIQLRRLSKPIDLLSHQPMLDYLMGKSGRQAEELLEEHLKAYW